MIWEVIGDLGMSSVAIWARLEAGDVGERGIGLAWTREGDAGEGFGISWSSGRSSVHARGWDSNGPGVSSKWAVEKHGTGVEFEGVGW
jgi:hypothetical protein